MTGLAVRTGVMLCFPRLMLLLPCLLGHVWHSCRMQARRSGLSKTSVLNHIGPFRALAWKSWNPGWVVCSTRPLHSFEVVNLGIALWLATFGGCSCRHHRSKMPAPCHQGLADPSTAIPEKEAATQRPDFSPEPLAASRSVTAQIMVSGLVGLVE